MVAVSGGGERDPEEGGRGGAEEAGSGAVGQAEKKRQPSEVRQGIDADPTTPAHPRQPENKVQSIIS